MNEADIQRRVDYALAALTDILISRGVKVADANDLNRLVAALPQYLDSFEERERHRVWHQLQEVAVERFRLRGIVEAVDRLMDHDPDKVLGVEYARQRGYTVVPCNVYGDLVRAYRVADYDLVEKVVAEERAILWNTPYPREAELMEKLHASDSAAESLEHENRALRLELQAYRDAFARLCVRVDRESKQAARTSNALCVGDAIAELGDKYVQQAMDRYEGLKQEVQDAGEG